MKDAVFCYNAPTPVDKPRLVAVSEPALRLVGIPGEATRAPEFLQYFRCDAHAC